MSRRVWRVHTATQSPRGPLEFNNNGRCAKREVKITALQSLVARIDDCAQESINRISYGKAYSGGKSDVERQLRNDFDLL